MRRIRTDDVDEFAEAQQGKNRRYLQLRAGHFQAELLDWQLPRVQLFRERVNVGMRVEAAPPSHLVPFSVVTSLPGAARFCGQDLAPGAFVQATGGHWDIRIDRGIDSVCCVFEREQFEQLGCELLGHPVDEAWLRSAVRSTDPAARARLGLRLHQLISGVALPVGQNADRLARLIEAELLELTIAALSSSEDDARMEPSWRRRRAVRRVIEYLEDSREPLPTIPELCRVAGVSQRTLEYGFRDLLGITPVYYTRVLRLNRARRALRAAKTQRETVTSVALRFGFVELGRFAVDYRRLFGERPSETLHRNSERAPRQSADSDVATRGSQSVRLRESA